MVWPGETPKTQCPLWFHLDISGTLKEAGVKVKKQSLNEKNHRHSCNLSRFILEGNVHVWCVYVCVCVVFMCMGV